MQSLILLIVIISLGGCIAVKPVAISRYGVPVDSILEQVEQHKTLKQDSELLKASAVNDSQLLGGVDLHYIFVDGKLSANVNDEPVRGKQDNGSYFGLRLLGPKFEVFSTNKKQYEDSHNALYYVFYKGSTVAQYYDDSRDAFMRLKFNNTGHGLEYRYYIGGQIVEGESFLGNKVRLACFSSSLFVRYMAINMFAENYARGTINGENFEYVVTDFPDELNKSFPVQEISIGLSLTMGY